MDTLIDYLVEARDAHLRNDWRVSYAAFVRADALGPMSTDDLDAYGTAAWRLGHGREAVRLAERTYDRLVRTDPAAAAMKATVLALEWHARGHLPLSRGWADRARALLSGVPASAALAYVAYLDATAALDDGDTAALVRAANALREAATGTGDPTLAILARVVDGVAALQESRVADGYRLLDDALLPVVDDRIPPEWAGDVYRLVLHPGRHVDARHAEKWTESLRRWVIVTGVVIDNYSIAGRS